MLKEVSFFCPVFNEQGSIEKVVESVNSVLKEISECYEIIIIDNCSTDLSPQIADSLARKISGVRVIHHDRNMEYGGALKTGFRNAKYNVVVYTDSDNQYDFNDFKQMLTFIPSYDVISGYRLKRHDSAYRKFQSRIFNCLINILFGLKVKDINCSFKVYKKKVLDVITIKSNSAFIDGEMLVKAKKNGFSLFEMPVKHFPRTTGLATGARPIVILLTLKELLVCWFSMVMCFLVKPFRMYM